MPPALAQFVPEYLPSVPADPFAGDGSPLRFLPNGPDPRLYSVASNGIDDGGSDRSPSPYDERDAVVHLRLQPRDLSRLADELREIPHGGAATAVGGR
jgi:hypothetical protein